MEFKFDAEPIFECAARLGIEMYHSGPSTTFRNIVSRSSIVDAVNHALNHGESLEGATLSGPALVGVPAFTMQDVTFCYWRRASDSSWSKISSAQSEDGSDKMLALLTSGPSGYKEWAENYFEVPVDLQSVSAVFAHQPLTESLVLALQPGSDLHFANEQAQEIGYPSRVS